MGDVTVLPTAKRSLSRDDILPLADYVKIRKESKARITAVKKHRRVEVGPFATFYFECYDTMWHQVHEMLFIEKGGEEQIADELRAYNPLVPKGDELVATVMFEIEDGLRRTNVLARLGGVERQMYVEFAGHKVMGAPEDDTERTDETGKASSVQFLHFHMTPAQRAAFKTAGTRVEVGIEHENYGHIAVMPEKVRAAIAVDLD